MKRLLNLTISSAVIFLSMAASPASNISKTSATGKTSKKYQITVNAYNATTASASFQFYGTNNLFFTLNPGSYTAPGLEVGRYTLYIYCSAPGSHTYRCGSSTVVSSNGYGAFFDVDISTNIAVGVL